MYQEQRALITSIAAAPADDLPRLVYADWLDEHCEPGQPGWPPNSDGMSAHAELIRLQVLMASDPTARTPDHLAREKKLKPLVADGLLGPHFRHHVATGGQRAPFHRGMLSWLDLKWLDGELRRPVQLVENLLVEGDVRAHATRHIALPRGMHVIGDFDATHLECGELPADMRIGGRFNLNFAKVRSLPANLQVGGNLVLKTEDVVRHLPDDLRVGGRLVLGSEYRRDRDFMAQVVAHPGLTTACKRRALTYMGFSHVADTLPPDGEGTGPPREGGRRV
jgi:uncharacterized protein (TIGR02996 family)